MRGDGVRILIVGAGIAGLAAARTLRRWDGAVEIVERAPAPTTEGTGIYCDGPPGQPLPLRDLLAGYAEPVPIPLDGLDEARLVDGCVLITGEVDRTTEFERGMPPAHQAWTGSAWQPDPLILDDQALVVHVRRRGLVVLTGCGHAGAINIVRGAQRLTGVPTLHALLGGLHLGGPAFEPIINPAVRALTEMEPSLVLAGHCTGWRAQHALAAALPDSWVADSSGSSFSLAAA
jgi:hypothetical protein